MPLHTVRRRKPHAKSRSGCEQCRKRRVKCDELRPTCSNYRNKNEECQYKCPHQMQGLHNFPLTQQSSPSKEGITASSADRTPDRDGLLTSMKNQNNTCPCQPIHLKESDELSLMHVWSTRTYFSFTSEHAPFLRDRVGKQALDCDFLMGALLASTSLQLAAESTDITSTCDLVTASLEHQNRAMAELKQNLQSLSPANCDDVFLTTVLMLVWAFGQSILPHGRYAQAKSAVDIMVDAFKFLEGAQTVGIRCFAWLF
jgi:hypothetical protein